jgi:hypothetical protein
MTPTLLPRLALLATTRPAPIAHEDPLALDRLATTDRGRPRGWRSPGRWVVTTGLIVAFAGAVAVWPARNARGEAAPDRPDQGAPGSATAPRAGGWPLFASAEARREDQMTAEIDAVRGRIREKEAIAAALIRGEMTAERAIARFAFFLGQEPTGQAALQCRHPGVADADLAIYMLIHFVERARDAGTAGADLVVAELQAAVARPGPELAAAVGGQ